MSNFPDNIRNTPLVGHPLDDVETVKCNYCGAETGTNYADKDYMCDDCRDVDISDLAKLLPEPMQVITRGSRCDNRPSNFRSKGSL